MSEVNKAIEELKKGKLIGLPTETVYGLAAPVDSQELVKQIFVLKERPFYDPLILHVSSVEMAKRYTEQWCETAQVLADSFWPGPLTIILKKSESVDDLITAGLPSVGVRCPKSELALSLIEELNIALAAPSANKFTKTSPSCAEHVRSSFAEKDVFVLDGGPCKVGIESTIISLLKLETDQVVEVLRPGMVAKEDLESVLPKSIRVVLGANAFEKEAARLSPGLEKVHYRPDFPCGVILRSRLAELASEGQLYEFVHLNANPVVTAREVYSLLRKDLAPNLSGRYFVVEDIEIDGSEEARESQLWKSILDRLLKASSLPCYC